MLFRSVTSSEEFTRGLWEHDEEVGTSTSPPPNRHGLSFRPSSVSSCNDPWIADPEPPKKVTVPNFVDVFIHCLASHADDALQNDRLVPRVPTTLCVHVIGQANIVFVMHVHAIVSLHQAAALSILKTQLEGLKESTSVLKHNPAIKGTVFLRTHACV